MDDKVWIHFHVNKILDVSQTNKSNQNIFTQKVHSFVNDTFWVFFVIYALMKKLTQKGVHSWKTRFIYRVVLKENNTRIFIHTYSSVSFIRPSNVPGSMVRIWFACRLLKFEKAYRAQDTDCWPVIGALMAFSCTIISSRQSK